jgi:hypothetical protein
MNSLSPFIKLHSSKTFSSSKGTGGKQQQMEDINRFLEDLAKGKGVWRERGMEGKGCGGWGWGGTEDARDKSGLLDTRNLPHHSVHSQTTDASLM